MYIEESGAGGFDKQARINELTIQISNLGGQNRNLIDANDKLKAKNKKLKIEIEQYRRMIKETSNCVRELEKARTPSSNAYIDFLYSYRNQKDGSGKRPNENSNTRQIHENFMDTLTGIFSLILNLDDAIVCARKKKKQKKEEIEDNEKIIDTNIKKINSNDLSIKRANNEIEAIKQSL